MRLSHASTRPGNADLDAQSVVEKWVVQYAKLALASGRPPSGTHDQPIVDVDVWWWLWGHRKPSLAVLRYWPHGPSRTTPRYGDDNASEKRLDGVLGTGTLSTFHNHSVATDNTGSGDSKGGSGWAMVCPDFCLAPRLDPPVFFLISRLSSFGWHMQGCQMRFVKIPAILSTAPELRSIVIRKRHRENRDNQ